MTQNNEQTLTQEQLDAQAQAIFSTATDFSEEDDKLYDVCVAKFRSYNLDFKMRAFRYCAKHKLDFQDFLAINPHNLLNILTIGLETHNEDEAYSIIQDWTEVEGYAYQLLHYFVLEQARANGFFMTDRDQTILALAGHKNPQDSPILQALAQMEILRQIENIKTVESML